MSITTGGYIFMILAWSFIIGLAGFCMYKVLHRGKQKSD